MSIEKKNLDRDRQTQAKKKNLDRHTHTKGRRQVRAVTLESLPSGNEVATDPGQPIILLVFCSTTFFREWTHICFFLRTTCSTRGSGLGLPGDLLACLLELSAPSAPGTSGASPPSLSNPRHTSSATLCSPSVSQTAWRGRRTTFPWSASRPSVVPSPSTSAFRPWQAPSVSETPPSPGSPLKAVHDLPHLQKPSCSAAHLPRSTALFCGPPPPSPGFFLAILCSTVRRSAHRQQGGAPARGHTEPGQPPLGSWEVQVKQLGLWGFQRKVPPHQEHETVGEKPPTVCVSPGLSSRPEARARDRWALWALQASAAAGCQPLGTVLQEWVEVEGSTASSGLTL